MNAKIDPPNKPSISNKIPAIENKIATMKAMPMTNINPVNRYLKFKIDAVIRENKNTENNVEAAILKATSEKICPTNREITNWSPEVRKNIIQQLIITLKKADFLFIPDFDAWKLVFWKLVFLYEKSFSLRSIPSQFS